MMLLQPLKFINAFVKFMRARIVEIGLSIVFYYTRTSQEGAAVHVAVQFGDVRG